MQTSVSKVKVRRHTLSRCPAKITLTLMFLHGAMQAAKILVAENVT